MYIFKMLKADKVEKQSKNTFARDSAQIQKFPMPITSIGKIIFKKRKDHTEC